MFKKLLFISEAVKPSGSFASETLIYQLLLLLDSGTAFITLHFLRNLQNGPISQSFCYLLAFPAQCYLTPELSGPIHKLRRKCSVVNMVPGTAFTTLHFLRNLQNGPISQSFCHSLAFPAKCYVTHKLIGPIRELRRKCSVVNTVPGLQNFFSWGLISWSGCPWQEFKPSLMFSSKA